MMPSDVMIPRGRRRSQALVRCWERIFIMIKVMTNDVAIISNTMMR